MNQMIVDSTYRLLDTLVEVDDLATAHGGSPEAVERRLNDVYRALAKQPPSADDFVSLLDSVYLNKISRIHRASWVAQHLFGGQPCCVNQRVLLERGGKLESPLIEQAAMRGIPKCSCCLSDVASSWRDARWSQLSVDAILVRADQNSIFVVKSCSFGQLRRVDSRIEVVTEAASLFQPQLPAVIHNASVDRGVIAALVKARDVVRAAMPSIAVRLFVMVMSDDMASWNFQCSEVTAADHAHLTVRKIGLNDFPIHASIRDFRTADGRALIGLDQMPHNSKLPSLETVLRDCVPVDRAARCVMMLRELFHRQKLATADDRLAVMSASELAKVVTDDYGIYYPKDQQRHDIEDCLWRGGFIDRPSRNSNRYAIKPKGIARMRVLKPKFNSMIPADSSTGLLERIREVGAIWRLVRDDSYRIAL